MAAAVIMKDVVKTYGGERALNSLTLSVAEGTVHGLLGPNGAGKTTAVRILSTLIRFDSGSVSVGGFDVRRQANRVRERIALTGQSAAVDEILSERQNLTLFGELAGLGRRAARQRCDELIDQFGLTAAAHKSAFQYSGGMRRKLDLAASLIRTPQVLFLDEPTTGLDPRSRNQVWAIVRGLVANGTTVLLTTQYLEEADQLADVVSVIDHGAVVAQGAPEDLKQRAGGDRIDVTLSDSASLSDAALILRHVGHGEVDIDADRRRVSVAITDRVAALSEAINALRSAGIDAADIGVRRPTLDEAFLYITGHLAHGEAVAT